jgi:pimeloyl-ACP methyl ester carboxylesterase
MPSTWDAWVAGGRFVTARGYRVFTRADGAGPDVVFLHGFPTSSFDWSQVALPGRRRITFDFLGFGASDKPRIDYDFELQLEALAAVAREHRVERAVVVAHDYGVTAAQELLARHAEGRAPFAVQKLLLLNGGLNPALHRARRIQTLMAGPLGPFISMLTTRSVFERSMRAILVKPVPLDEHWAALEHNGGRRVLPRLLQYMAERRRKADRWTQALIKTEVPLAFFWGLQDPVSGGHMLEWVRSVRPDAPVEALEVGHYPQLEAPDDFARWLVQHATVTQ